MNLVLLTDYRGALRQRLQVFQTLDVDALVEELARLGIATRSMRFEDVANGEDLVQGETIHYTSTQDPGYRGFVDDVLDDLRRHNTLVPRYEIFRSHENKGYQELEKRRLGIRDLGWHYFGNLQGWEGDAGEITYPVVFKATRGFMSSGVRLVDGPDALRHVIRRFNRPPGFTLYRVKKLIKQTVMRGRFVPEMYTDCPFGGGFVLQEFSPGALGDWKVLTYGDRVYAVQREVRPGDFRASGSGRLAFATPPDVVLDFARDIHTRLDMPMSSLDIIEVAGTCRLVEFQGLHFGTYTQENGPHHFVHGPDGWRRIDGRHELVADYAHALHWFLARHPDSGRS